MTAQHSPDDERERSFRRLRRFYQISAEREWQRLENPGEGALEFAINKHYIARHLPPDSRVLDLGGGPGQYAIWLAQEGHRVVLADLSPHLLELARQKLAEAGVTVEDVAEANATDLSMFEDASFDAALCLGPFYHLLSEDDRRKAAAELCRVVRPGGLVFAAFMTRLIVLRTILHGFFPLSQYMLSDYERWLKEGLWVSPVDGLFTDACFVWPQEVAPFMERAGFRTLELVSSESLASHPQAQLQLFELKKAGPELWQWLFDLVVEHAGDPSILGMANHLMYIGRKP